jgi:hypothetical protein
MIANQIETCKQLFVNNPTPSAIFHSKSLTLEFANQAMLNLWDKPKHVIGLDLLDFLPEVEEQGFADLLRVVGYGNKGFQERGAKVNLMRNGKMESIYMDYSFTPIKGLEFPDIGILVLANDVTDRELSLLHSDGHRGDLSDMVLLAPVPMCILRGLNLEVEAINLHMVDLWPQIKQKYSSTIKKVIRTGYPHEFEDDGTVYAFTALRNDEGKSIGCILIVIKGKTTH